MTLKRMRAWYRSLWLPNAVILDDGNAYRISKLGHIILWLGNSITTRLFKALHWDARRTEAVLKRKGR